MRTTATLGLALFAALTAAPVYAQNNKPVRSGNFYEDRATASVTSAGLVLTFALTPSDKYTNITHVTCSMNYQSAQFLGPVTFRIGTTPGASDIGRTFEVGGSGVRSIPMNPLNTTFTALNNGVVLIKMGPNRYPSLAIQTFNTDTLLVVPTVTADCTIVGELSDN